MSDRLDLEQTISNLTRSQLEEIIEAIAKKTIHQEMIANKPNASRDRLAKTFGAWQDERTDEEIIQEIYDRRNTSITQI